MNSSAGQTVAVLCMAVHSCAGQTVAVHCMAVHSCAVQNFKNRNGNVALRILLIVTPVVPAVLVQVAVEVLQLVPGCSTPEIRISHKLLLDACLAQCEVPQELRQSALALLSTAAGASPLHPAARPKLWPSIKSVSSPPMGLLFTAEP